MKQIPHHVVAVFTILVLLLLPAAACRAQQGAGTGGLARLAQEKRLAGSWRRVLMIGAHPDDEDTELLTILARGEGMQTAYLSLTRGDGGQNLIGPELGEMLGVLRTDELMSARAIDGGRQFFTRAFDFGFSKTAEETLAFWGHDAVLEDMVRVIRRFRPQVVISVWQGTPADGHGHHIASGILSLEAYHAAGDSTRFPELEKEGLKAWQPAKFYRVARGGGGAGTLTFNGGVIDPAVGMSFHQIAARSRSQHRSQNQGAFEELGPSRTGVRLAERVPSITGPDDSLFAGIPAEPVTGTDPASVEAALIERGIVLDATTATAEVTPGEQFPVTVRAWNTGRDTAFMRFRMVPLDDFTSRGDGCPSGAYPVAPGVLFTCTFAMTVWPNATPTSPYYLDAPRNHDLYDWTHVAPALRGEPVSPPLQAEFTLLPDRVARSGLPTVREVQARLRDPVIGEVRQPLNIVQPITVDLEPGSFLWPVGQRTRELHVVLEHLAHDSADATVSLRVPTGWTVSAPQAVHFARTGERATLAFKVIAPLKVESRQYAITAQVVSGKATLTTGLYRIRYPHIRGENIVTAAESDLLVADVKFPHVGTIGYVRGGGDMVPEALTNAGLHVALLTGDALERDSLDRYKVIIIGPRAYEADASLVRANPRLMKWLAAGGTLLIQYQQTPYTQGGFAPRPLTIVAPTQSRVTDETAPVTFLAPLHPALHTPNLIGPKDFEGWVQERGLDFPPQWDPAWTPLLEMHDPDSPPLRGGLLVAHVGRGTAIYTGLSFHRELPALVPGAWRLFANLLALGQPTAAAKKP